MGLVLDTFANLPTKGRRLAVLADMLELGPDALKMHASMAEHLDPADFAGVYLYGPQMKALYEKLNEKYPDLYVQYFETDKEQLIATVKEEIRPEDSIVLKGSNGMGLIDVVKQLQGMK